MHDFPDPDIPKAVPRGVYDPELNLGWVTVGCSHDTASFAVESIRRWWREMGHPLYPQAERVLICADSGGSNGYRIRLWKLELQRWANETGLDVTVCHYPPGTSKWNKIEHRLFSHITMNWRGRPLVSYQVIVNLIGATTTRAGLRVQADLDTDVYPTKVKVTDKQLATVDLHPHRFHGEWNYTIKRQNNYSGLPWCCTQSGMSEPAEDVLGCHAPQRLAHGIIEPRPRPRLGSTEILLDLREHLLDRGVVWAVRR